MFSKGCQCSVILMRGFCEAACEHWYP
jgi:hypothetical protein